MLNVALVGHVDHGKSTLIGRLLYNTNSLPEGKIEEIKKTCEALGRKLEFAYIVDALEEERRNQMTIETAQVFFKSSKRDYALIDAPGHKEFIKNMVTGTSQADAAILIVDVKERVKEQTKRHSYLLKLLGIPSVIVVINKMDLVGHSKEAFERVKSEVMAYLNSIGIKPTAVIPISAYKGDNVVKKSKNMQWYTGSTVLEALDKLEKTEEINKTVVFVQDEFNGKYLANLLSGSISKKETLIRLPEDEIVKVNKIFYGENEVESLEAPKAIGIITDKKLARGNILAKSKNFSVTKEIPALIFVLERRITTDKDYKLKCLTQETNCKISSIEERIDIETLENQKTETLKETDIGVVKIKTEKPVVFDKSLPEIGRFVLLDNGRIVAGGRLI
jgi:small GTP-binding protein